MSNNLSIEKKEDLKLAVRTFYDYQNLRIGSGNRTADPDDFEMVFDERTKKEKRRKKKVPKPGKRQQEEALMLLAETLGQDAPGKAPKTLEEKDRERLKRHSLIFMGLERDTLEHITEMIQGVSIYESFLKGVSGCGPTMAGVILSEITMHRPARMELLEDVERKPFTVQGVKYFKAEVTQTFEPKREGDEPKVVTKELTFYEHEDGTIMQDCCPSISSLWSYAGFATDPETGLAVRRKKGVTSNWNPLLKAKMVGVLAACLLRTRGDNKYKKLYYDYKHRKESAGWGKSPKHRDNAAKRYMIKIFLSDLWAAWRKVEGLPVTLHYAEAMLGRKHGDHGGTNIH